MIELVKQLEPLGCGVACLAMLTGKSYADVRQDFPNAAEKGISIAAAEEWLRAHDFEIETYLHLGLLDPCLFRGLTLGCTPRWTPENGCANHAIVVADGRVYDPSNFPYPYYPLAHAIKILGEK